MLERQGRERYGTAAAVSWMRARPASPKFGLKATVFVSRAFTLSGRES